MKAIRAIRAHLAAWSLTILGPVFMISPLINPELDEPWAAVMLGLVMTLIGVFMVRVLRRDRGKVESTTASTQTGAAGATTSGEPAEEMRWATNAPASWPAISTPVDVPGSLPPVLTLRMAATLKRAFEAQAPGLSLAAVSPSYLLESGVLEAAIEVADGDRKVPVFLYGEAGPQSAAHFAGVRQALLEQGLEAVYFAPEPLDDAALPGGDFASPLGLDGFTLHRSELESGHYSMWWPTPGDDDARTAPCLQDIERYYRAMDGREAWFVGFLLHELGTLEEPRPAALPEELDVFAATGPESTVVLFSVSAEKGLRLHFHESTETRVRDRIWRHLATFCEHFRQQLDDQDVPELPGEQERPMDWWKSMGQLLDRLASQGEPVERVGSIPL